jgi:hypothetical protein
MSYQQDDGSQESSLWPVAGLIAGSAALAVTASLVATRLRRAASSDENASAMSLPAPVAAAQQNLAWARRGMRAQQMAQPLTSLPSTMRWMRRGAAVSQLAAPVRQIPDRARWFRRGRRAARMGTAFARLDTGQRWYRRGITQGILIGVALGILIAPGPGEASRAWLERTARDLWARNSGRVQRVAGLLGLMPTTEVPGSPEAPRQPSVSRDGAGSAHARV